ncbi:MAG: undecaprenyldiphospho-muramoylpentapeptide beta-N-acetylglucosaminyltransferase [Bacteroidetes bacterium]|nr:undecaprenyldiphospho-muramoylpentapeptide beta-N-acetylglucosaminyltransferase [Bacteroidota bacterium]
MKLRKEVSLPPLKFILSGGGTGGHIFPAIAIANALKVMYPDAEFLFVGAKGRMEMEKVPAAGYKIEGLWISGLQRRFTLENLSFPFKVVSSILRARRILRSFKPDAVIGTGGYASGPMLRVAARAGVPTLIHEGNSYPGITSKILASSVDRICVAYDHMERFFPKEKLLVTGNPVRQDILKLDGKRTRALEMFKLDGERPVVLVIGGSLGARTVNEAIGAGLQRLSEAGIQLLWQTGEAWAPKAKELAAKFNGNILPHAFIREMDYAYAAADVVVSRAGASSISELAIVNKPVVFVPSPFVAEDHQTKNAMALVNKGAGLLIKDADAQTHLITELIKLVNDDERRHQFTVNIAALAIPDAAQRIASEVMSLVNRRKS